MKQQKTTFWFVSCWNPGNKKRSGENVSPILHLFIIFFCDTSLKTKKKDSLNNNNNNIYNNNNNNNKKLNISKIENRSTYCRHRWHFCHPLIRQSLSGERGFGWGGVGGDEGLQSVWKVRVSSWKVTIFFNDDKGDKRRQTSPNSHARRAASLWVGFGEQDH